MSKICLTARAQTGKRPAVGRWPDKTRAPSWIIRLGAAGVKSKLNLCRPIYVDGMEGEKNREHVRSEQNSAPLLSWCLVSHRFGPNCRHASNRQCELKSSI